MRLALRALRLLPGVAVLVLLAERLGGGPFVAAVRALSGPTLAAALAIGAATTVLSAWRWVLVADGLGIRLRLRCAVGSYYRALFLNGVLPGGVLGDVHRAVRHGQDVGSVPLAARAVVLERCAGQAVLVGTALLVALITPSALMPVAGGISPAVRVAAAVAVVVLAGLLALAGVRNGPLKPGRQAGRRRRVLAASAAVVAGHIATFVLATRAAGAAMPLGRLLPLALLCLLAMSVPLNVAGWGPREGVTAWAFGAAGMTAAQGLTIAVLYGLLALVASLPGAIVLLSSGVRSWAHGRPHPRTRRASRRLPAPSPVSS